MLYLPVSYMINISLTSLTNVATSVMHFGKPLNSYSLDSDLKYYAEAIDMAQSAKTIENVNFI